MLVGQLADQGGDVAGLAAGGSAACARCGAAGAARSGRSCAEQPEPLLPWVPRAAAGAGAGGSRCCRLGLRVLRVQRGSSRRGCRAGADDGEDGANLGGLVLVDADFLERAGNRGGDLGVNLVGGNLEQRLIDGYGVAHGLQPAGDGAFGDAFAQGGQGDVVAFAAGSGRGLCGRSFLSRCGGSFFCGGLCGGSCRCFFCGGCRCGGCAAAGTVTDADQGSAYFGGLVFGYEDFLDNAGYWRGDFSVYFVGGNLEQRFVHLYPVTYLLEPAGDGSFGDTLTEGGQVNGFRHVVPVLLIDL